MTPEGEMPLLLPAWEVVRIVELEPFRLTDGEDHEDIHYRVEILRSLVEAASFRVRLYRGEFFRLTPTFPQDPELFEPLHRSDEVMWIEDTDVEDLEFFAATGDDALGECLRRIARYWANRIM
ncbi:MAG: hypothetical protein KF858_03575 [Candidatus Sumerlaeia bacterium]|nr:hypothetical protein [Candidatus Sumerlaeia bacterium]